MMMKRAEKAFTIIEMLVVIGIMMVLAGILVPVLSGVRERTKVRLEKTTLKNICLALDRYYADFGCYPPDTGDFGQFGDDRCQDGATPNDPYSLYRYLSGAEGRGLTWKGRRFGPYMAFTEDRIVDDGGADDERIVIDAWGNPWVYEESQSYSLMKADAPEKGFYQPAHRPASYDLYSVGPDGQLDAECHNMEDDDLDGLIDEPDEVGTGGHASDDITNWW